MCVPGSGFPLLAWGFTLMFARVCLCVYRFRNSQRRMICGRFLNALAASRGFSSPRTGTRRERKGLHSLASRSGAMLQRLVRKSMAVSVTADSQNHASNKVLRGLLTCPCRWLWTFDPSSRIRKAGFLVLRTDTDRH